VTGGEGESPWREKLAVAAAFTAPGLLMRLSGSHVPYPLQLVVYGTAVVAAAFMLAWACEAAQVDIAHGVAIAGVAFVAILPEYVVEVNFAFRGQADYVTANLTGASRLLLGVCVSLPAAVALLPRRWRPHTPIGPVAVDPAQRIELAVLGAAALWGLRGVALGHFTFVDSAVLVGLYGIYLRRVMTAGGESPPPLGLAAQLAALPRRERRRWVGALMGYSAAVVLITAVPFGEAVLGSGSLVGVSPYVLLQWIVPVATEVPELVVAFVLLTHGRGGQSIAVLLAGAVSQYTLALGTLPVAYHLGAGAGPLPLVGRERVEILLSAGVALYAIAALISLRLSRGDAAIMLALSILQIVLPFPFTRLALALSFMAIALDVLSSEREYVRPLVAVLLGRPYGARAGAGSVRRSAAPMPEP
jgi:cation:H+ antiporter